MVLSMIGMAIMPNALPSESRILLSTLSLKKVIESFVQLVYSPVNHSDQLITF